MNDDCSMIFENSSPMIRQSSVSAQDWFSIFIEKIKLGSLSALIHLYSEYEHENQESLFQDEEHIFYQSANDGWTLLHEACSSGHSHIVQFLISRQCCPNQESEDGRTPLIISVLNLNLECVRALLKHPRVQVNKMTQFFPPALHLACKKGSAGLVQLLIEHKASMSLEDQKGLIPLQYASTGDIFEMIPRYVGQIELLKAIGKYEKIKVERFKAEIFLIINEEMVKMWGHIDPVTGKFGILNEKMDWVAEFWAYDIWDIKMGFRSNAGMGNWKGFILMNKNGVHKFWLKDRESVENWIDQINLLVQFCHFNKVGYRGGLKKANEEALCASVREPERPVGVKCFTVLSEIGRSKYGKLFKVAKNDTGQVFAMNQLSRIKLKEKICKILTQVKLLKDLSHPFIVKLYFSFQTEKKVFLLFDFCETKLSEFINSNTKLNEWTSKSFICQLVLAVEYLHSLDIIHRNIKPENILIDKGGLIRLHDFKFAKEKVNLVNRTFSFCGTPAYMSPDLFSSAGYHKSADIYAIGVILYEMLVGSPPYFADDIKEVFRNILRGMLMFPKSVGPEAQDLIKLLMNRDPAKRPDFIHIKSHAFFKDVDWEEIEIAKYSRLEETVETNGKNTDFIDYTGDEEDWFIKDFNFSRLGTSFFNFN